MASWIFLPFPSMSPTVVLIWARAIFIGDFLSLGDFWVSVFQEAFLWAIDLSLLESCETGHCQDHFKDTLSLWADWINLGILSFPLESTAPSSAFSDVVGPPNLWREETFKRSSPILRRTCLRSHRFLWIFSSSQMGTYYPFAPKLTRWPLSGFAGGEFLPLPRSEGAAFPSLLMLEGSPPLPQRHSETAGSLKNGETARNLYPLTKAMKKCLNFPFCTAILYFDPIRSFLKWLTSEGNPLSNLYSPHFPIYPQKWTSFS